jgi:hypothetical protein
LEGGTDMDELTVEVFEIEDKEALIDEIMNKYGQEILQLVYSYVILIYTKSLNNLYLYNDGIRYALVEFVR